MNYQSSSIEKIGLLQLFVLIVLFQIGSAVVVGIAVEAKQDAWIAILIATLFGVVIVRMYTFILSYQEGKNFFEILDQTVGRVFACMMTFVYCIYFFYIAARVLRDFLELLIADIYPKTPIEVFALVFMVLVVYVVYLGPEVLARTSETFIPYIFIFLFLVFLFLFIGGEIKVENLKPVLAEGFGPILKAVFPELIGFPFGEAIALTTVMAMTNKFQHISKVSMAAVVTTGLTLVLFKFIQISVLGVDMVERATFPLLSASREISFADFIERVDSVVIFIMMLGIFIKVSLFYFSGLKALEYIFKIPYRYMTIPSAMTIALFSILIASNFAEHIEEGIDFVPLYLHMPLQIGFPLLITIVIIVKKMKKGEQKIA